MNKLFSARSFTRIANAVGDLRLGIRADGIRETSKSGAVYYASSSHRHIREVLDRLELTISDSFVDIGCGKGRVLAIADDAYRVGAITGIEYEPELVRIARDNLGGAMVVIEQGAAEKFNYCTTSVAYAFNPVEPDILDLILAKIYRDRSPLPFRMAYVMESPEHQEVFARHMGWLKRYDQFIDSAGRAVSFYHSRGK